MGANHSLAAQASVSCEAVDYIVTIRAEREQDFRECVNTIRDLTAGQGGVGVTEELDLLGMVLLNVYPETAERVASLPCVLDVSTGSDPVDAQPRNGRSN